MSANVDQRRGWACSVNGRPDFRQAQCRGSAVVLWRRWSFLIAALQDSVNTAASRHRGSGVMPARISSWGIGIARRQPETVQNVVEGGVKLFMWALLHQTGAQYSAAEKTNARVKMCKVLIKVLQVVSTRWRIRATWADVFSDRFTRCCRNASVLSKLTPRYVGNAWN